jgi:hypothetical protein
MFNPLIDYELEMAVRDQTQLQHQVYFWRLVKQAPGASNAPEQSTPGGLLSRLLGVRTSFSVATGRKVRNFI